MRNLDGTLRHGTVQYSIKDLSYGYCTFGKVQYDILHLCYRSQIKLPSYSTTYCTLFIAYIGTLPLSQLSAKGA